MSFLYLTLFYNVRLVFKKYETINYEKTYSVYFDYANGDTENAKLKTETNSKHAWQDTNNENFNLLVLIPLKSFLLL